MDNINDSFTQFVEKSKQIGDVVQQAAKEIEAAVKSHLQIINIAASTQKPDEQGIKNLLKPCEKVLLSLQELKDKNRKHELFNHLAALCESVPALGWIAISPTPAPYVKEMINAAQFYTNKVLVAYKNTNKLHIEWVASWVNFLEELTKFIRQNHTTGLTWNQNGQPLSSMSGAPPPPPPPPSMSGMPPPPPPPPTSSTNTGDDAAVRAALMKQLNQGTDITKNLRRTNKGLAPPSGRSSQSKSPDPRATPSTFKGVPKFEFEGRKWSLDYQNGSTQEQFTINATEMNQTVNIYRCEHIMVVVQGKVNTITVDSCKKLSLVFDDIVSLVEFINCQNIQTQPMGKVPTITIDKTDGIQLFLKKESLDVELISAKSAEINVCIVDEVSGDYKEHALPEQLKTVWTGGKFKTEALDKA